MIHIIKNNKWVIAISVVCILFGFLTFVTFTNQSFIKSYDLNLQSLIFIDLALLIVFFILIIRQTFKVFKEKKDGEIGSKTTLRYIKFFFITTLLPSIAIAFFSLIILNVTLQTYFTKKIKSAVNNSAEVAKNYIEETKNSVEADSVLIMVDINRNLGLFYDNPKRFQDLLSTQRLLRRLDEVHLIDGAGNIIMSNVDDTSISFYPPPEEAFERALSGNSVRITDPKKNRTSSLIKLDNFIDTYLYIVKFMDPQVINYLAQTGEAIDFYYNIQERKTGIKITFAIIYIIIVSLLLFISVIIAVNFASQLTTPIINLIKASEKISSGDLNTKVPRIKTDKEFEKLNENFNSMIEKLKKQQDKLLLTERHLAWESVARKLAHEIKNPLTPIQLSIDRIREKYLSKITDDKESFSNYLDTMNKQIKDIEHLVTEFSDFARMPKPIFRKVNINELISRSLKLNELSEPDIKFKLSKNKSLNYIKGDEEQLHRVFLNLIKNSIESINEKSNKIVDFRGKINIEIRDDSDYIYFTINDNGVGFEKIDKQKLLTPYFTTKKNGSGLGLAIVSKIISDHNSSISFNSINGGAEIEIMMPKIND